VSNLSDGKVDISIVPEFQMVSTPFEYAVTSYESMVNFLIVKGPSDYSCK
jgi:hypothetical protein